MTDSEEINKRIQECKRELQETKEIVMSLLTLLNAPILEQGEDDYSDITSLKDYEELDENEDLSRQNIDCFLN